jgi:MFS family permease
MALTAGSIAVLPGYATLGVVAPALLILLRVVQGLAFGGELPGAMCFLGEQVPAAHRRLAALGILIGRR